MARRGIAPNSYRMSIFNSFDKLSNGNWAQTGEYLIVCVCGWLDGFRVFPDGEITTTVAKHNEECPLRN